MREQDHGEQLAWDMAHAEIPFRDIAVQALKQSKSEQLAESERDGMRRIAAIAVSEADKASDTVELRYAVTELEQAHDAEVEPRMFLRSLRNFTTEQAVVPGNADGVAAFEATRDVIKRDRSKLDEAWAMIVHSNPKIPAEATLDTAIENLHDKALGDTFHNYLETVYEPSAPRAIAGGDDPAYLKAIHFISTLYVQLKALHTASRLHKAHDGTPSLYDLPDDARQGVLDAFYADWADYTELAQRAGFDTLTDRRMKPLIYQSADTLRSCLLEDIVPADKIVSMFVTRPRTFQAQHERARASKLDRGRTAVGRHIGEQEREINRRVETALANEDYRTFAQNREALNTLSLAKTAEVEQAILAVCGQLAEEAAEQFGQSEANVWSKTVTNPINERIRPRNFYGRLENTRLIHMPADDEFIDNYTESWTAPETVNRGTFTRIGIMTDMHSTGRKKVGESFQEVIVFIRDIDNPKRRRIALSSRGGASGDKVAAYLNRESYGAAVLQTIRNLSNPLPGGLPGLGKKSR